jgi:CDP-L-myo-inositol myo-inositolphosphotransferase
VGGVSVVERHLVGLAREGVRRVWIRCDDGATVGSFLSRPGAHPRLGELQIESSAADNGAAGDATLRVDGRRLCDPALIRQALAHVGPCRILDAQGHAAGVAKGGPEGTPIRAPAEAWSERVDSIAGRRRATERLLASLSKPTDGWFSLHLNRPLSTRITRLLAPYPVPPDLVTLLTLVVGLSSGLLSALGTPMGFAWGGVLFQAASVLDGVDGELARLRFQATGYGEWLDTICDDLTNFVYLAGVTLGTWRSLGSSVLLAFGVAALALDVVVVAFLYWAIARRPDGRSLLVFQVELEESATGVIDRAIRAVQPLVKRDAYGVAFMLFALAGVPWLALVGTTAALAVTLPAVISIELRSPGRKIPATPAPRRQE